MKYFIQSKQIRPFNLNMKQGVSRVIMQINLCFEQKFGRVIVFLEVVYALTASFILWMPTGPENSSMILNCLGKDDVIYFEYDYFIPGGYSRKQKFCVYDNITTQGTKQQENPLPDHLQHPGRHFEKTCQGQAWRKAPNYRQQESRVPPGWNS